MTCQLEDRLRQRSIKDKRAADDLEIRVFIKQWLLNTMKEHNWTAERWAKQAGVSGTTITRFLNSDDPNRTPNSVTIEKLRRAAGGAGLHAPQQFLIALVRRSTLLDAARRDGPAAVDLFSMPPDDYVPAPEKYRACRLAEMDNGRFAICQDAAPRAGGRALALFGASNIVPVWNTSPVLVPLHPSEMAVPKDVPAVILGKLRGEFFGYADEDDED